MFDQDARSAISKINQVSSFLRDRYSGMEELIDLMINCVPVGPGFTRPHQDKDKRRPIIEVFASLAAVHPLATC
jgi:hypothetical protein